jgi:hypothetical protein
MGFASAFGDFAASADKSLNPSYNAGNTLVSRAQRSMQWCAADPGP